MLNYILKAAGAIVIGTVGGIAVCETVTVIRKYKNMRKEYQDMKTSDAIKQAVIDRVEEIKKDPREIIFPAYTAVSGGIMYFVGHFLGLKQGFQKGWEEGIWTGVREGVVQLQEALWNIVPKEYRKFLNIIKGKMDETEIFRHKYNNNKEERWWSWDPAKALSDRDKKESEEVAEA